MTSSKNPNIERLSDFLGTLAIRRVVNGVQRHRKVRLVPKVLIYK